ncbi:hypothetical protein FRC07_009361, partial [Ceratobasidium sp. 392]
GSRHAPSAPLTAAQSTTFPDPPLDRRRLRLRRKFTDAFFASSQDLLRIGSAWSARRSGREGLLLMQFDLGRWRDESCKTEQWYQTQLERSREKGSTTQFKTIQHRRTLDAPFYHEFLLIPLADGPVFRVERTGQGFTADAVSRIGCAACDLIEWFPAEKYETFIHDRPSELVSQVQFSSELDILEVLAVCYSIQLNQRACRYTLQGFNCYFFCCTILSVLARRVADWDKYISLDGSPTLLEAVLDRISICASSGPESKAKRYGMLRICSIVDPNNQSPAQVLLDALRHVYDTTSDFFGCSRNTFMHSLWWPEVVTKFQAPLSIWIELAVKDIYEKRDSLDPVSYLLRSTSTGKRQAGEDHADSLKLLCEQESFASQMAYHSDTRGVDKIRLMAKASAFAPLLNRRLQTERLASPSAFDIRVKAQFDLPTVTQLSQDTTNEVVNAILDKLESTGECTAENVEAICLLLTRNHSEFWNDLLLELLRDCLEIAIKDSVASPRVTARIYSGAITQTTHEEVDIFALQDHVLKHIIAYTDRAASYGLGSSMFSSRDIRSIMSEVWAQTP